ncbi:hypothetical protein [Mesorhizobium sp. 8]|uniref:hypothetical protein n=1 Tax=Mesorhizobium sp. 8 TaxID=2584466 RepID=UPI0011209B36|nr:hypothetical protein [Mesorhizobium sp. 8]QDB99782.1 hypothetical protein FGU64_04805 [Mesorhizobium sp. 8]
MESILHSQSANFGPAEDYDTNESYRPWEGTLSDEQPQAAPFRDPSLMALGRLDAFLLFAFYLAGLLWSGYRLFPLLAAPAQDSLKELMIIEVLSLSALAGSAIFYARKLYKAGINQIYNFSPDGITVNRLSTIAYFILRIPTAIAISLVLYGIWRISIDLAVQNEFSASKSSSRYLFLVMGFFSGFSSGRIITYFETEGLRFATRPGEINGNS